VLEVLLHDVLDEEVDTSDPNNPSEQRLLPNVLSFLSSFPEYLDIVVQCTRKTEVRSWRTLFAHLPPPRELFEESLGKGSLKTAGGYLLVLHNLEELSTSSDELVRLLKRAKEEQDWELCKELARFLMALDQTGETLETTLRMVDLLPTSIPLANGHTTAVPS
jgi:RAB6A-GEF complex partner protein 1